MINCAFYNLLNIYNDKRINKNAIIINTINDASEDIYLGRKINKLLITLGYSTTVYPLLLKTIDKPQKNISDYFIEDAKSTTLSNKKNNYNSQNTIVVIVPIITIQTKKLSEFLNIIYDQHNLKKNKIFVFTDKIHAEIFDISLFDKNLAKRISCNYLGLHKNSLGYVPLEDSEIALLNKNFRTIIEILCDSINIDLCITDHFFVGYFKSASCRMSMLIFLHNSLLELQSRVILPSSYTLNYIFFCEPQINNYELQAIIDESTESSSIYYTKAQKINFYCYGDILKLINSTSTSSQSRKTVNIFFINKILPENIFNCFIALSSYGIMSSINSYINYISIKQELPYYCFNEQELSFVNEVLDEAKNYRLHNLHHYYKCKLIDESSSTVNQYNVFENAICNKKNFEIYQQNYRLQERIQVKETLRHINMQKSHFESTFIKRYAKKNIAYMLP